MYHHVGLNQIPSKQVSRPLPTNRMPQVQHFVPSLQDTKSQNSFFLHFFPLSSIHVSMVMYGFADALQGVEHGRALVAQRRAHRHLIFQETAGNERIAFENHFGNPFSKSIC